MIVRKLPNVSSRWPPPNHPQKTTQNPIRPNNPSNPQTTKPVQKPPSPHKYSNNSKQTEEKKDDPYAGLTPIQIWKKKKEERERLKAQQQASANIIKSNGIKNNTNTNTNTSSQQTAPKQQYTIFTKKQFQRTPASTNNTPPSTNTTTNSNTNSNPTSPKNQWHRNRSNLITSRNQIQSNNTSKPTPSPSPRSTTTNNRKYTNLSNQTTTSRILSNSDNNHQQRKGTNNSNISTYSSYNSMNNSNTINSPQQQRKGTNNSNISSYSYSNNNNNSNTMSPRQQQQQQQRKGTNMSTASYTSQQSNSYSHNHRKPSNGYISSRKSTDNYNNGNIRKQSNNYIANDQAKSSNNYAVGNGQVSSIRKHSNNQYGNGINSTIRKGSNHYINNNNPSPSRSINNVYHSPKKRKQSNNPNPNISTSPLPSPMPRPLALRNKQSEYSMNSSFGSTASVDIPQLTNNPSRSRSNHREKDIKRRIYELFARDKLIKWVYDAKTRIYEPIFVVIENHGSRDQVIARDSRGIYKLYNKRDVMEAPPYDEEIIIINAVEQLLRGYQRRYKASSLRKQKVVEVITRSRGSWISSGTTDTIFAQVIGFENSTENNLSNVVLQEKVNDGIHSFPVQNVKENHMIDVETNEKLFVNDGANQRKSSFTQYVSPSYWLSSNLSDEQKINEVNNKNKNGGNGERKQQQNKEDIKKKQELEKQQRALLGQIETINNETLKLQKRIMHKMKVIENKSVDNKNKMNETDKQHIAALSVLWGEVLKHNNRLQIQLKAQKQETDSWRQIAAENVNEIRLLKQQITNLKAEPNRFKSNKQTAQSKQETQALQHKLQHAMNEQKINMEKIQSVQCENDNLRKQIKDMQIKKDSRQLRTPPISQMTSTSSSASEQLQRGGGLQVDSSFLTVKEVLSDYQSLRDQEYHNLHCELKKTLKEIKSKSWHKLYINQVCHQFMFDLLHLCYKNVKKYEEAIYQQIGNALCIQQITNDKSQQNEKLNFVFHFYLQENHDILFNYFKNMEIDKLVDKTKQIYNKRTQCHLSAEGYVLLSRYLQKCCNICWLMVLQRPKLTLYPKEFKPILKSVAFDGEQHSKSMGSDRKSNFVLYYVWPSVRRNQERLDMNIQVILRNSDVPINKKR